MDVQGKNHLIFDAIYGFIELSNLEWEIIHSPFYQRLRWIKQLGFSSFVFPGAEHSRFGHSIGVMYNAHKILESIGKTVSMQELNVLPLSAEALFHQSIRLAALLHDVGTFPFSHTLEASYIKFGESTRTKKDPDQRADDHENLGSFIIKNSNYPTGITYILNNYGIRAKDISDLVKGVNPSILANQILHSEIDCDRMDYLLRDAHYTGLKYGTYDRAYLLHHFTIETIAGHEILTVKHNALHCVEDFLMARFAWYSQVIRTARGAKFDAIAEEMGKYLLHEGIVYKFDDLLEMIKNGPLDFFQFNDSYFLNVICQKIIKEKKIKDTKVQDLARFIVLEQSPRTIRCEEFSQKLLNQDEPHMIEKVLKKAYDKISHIEHILKKKGNESDWIVTDIPTTFISFIKSHKRIVKGQVSSNILLERDPVKISFDNGDVKLLADVENSVISKLQNCFNFVPNVFCSESAYRLLEKEQIFEKA